MKRPTDNPFVNFPSDYTEGVMLTMLQSIALPVLLWFFDTNVGRGSGRTYMAAVLVVELAKRGNRVMLTGDPSLELLHPREHRRGAWGDKSFVELVFRIALERYPRDVFVYDDAKRELVYRGERPR